MRHPEVRTQLEAVKDEDGWETVEALLNQFEQDAGATQVPTSPHVFTALRLVTSNYHDGRACKNSILVRRDRLEDVLLSPIRDDLLKPDRVTVPPFRIKTQSQHHLVSGTSAARQVCLKGYHFRHGSLEPYGLGHARGER